VYAGRPLKPGDAAVREYIQQQLLNRAAPASWFAEIKDEAFVDFQVDESVLPAVVTPALLKQRLLLRHFPRPMMEIDLGMNQPDKWS
jgi:hypothetical protein